MHYASLGSAYHNDGHANIAQTRSDTGSSRSHRSRRRQRRSVSCLEPGSSNSDFSIDSQNSAIAANWPALALRATANRQVDVSLDLANLTNAVIGLLGLATGVVGVVAVIAA
jgi:hypothetical protein